MTRAFGWLAGVVSVLGAIVGVFDLVGSPIWPKLPVIEAGDPSYSHPLAIPFKVTNSGIAFSMRNVVAACRAELTYADGLPGGTLAATNQMELKPRETKPLSCDFQSQLGLPSPEKVLEAELGILMRYNVEPWPIKWERRQIVSPFVWHPELSPPRWIKGNDMSNLRRPRLPPVPD